ncbi:unnamed protein product [Alternaria alternata]
MAEVVGTVAAVVQFVDVALRLSSCLERFCSDVRSVPRRFLQLQIDLRQQIEIAQHIQNDHVPGFATTVSSLTLDAPLLEYTSLAEELSKTLEGLLSRKNDGMLQRGWSGICSLRKKEEVANICDRLEQKRSILSVWLNAANLKLSSETAATTDQVRLEIGETLTLVKTVDKTSSATEHSTAQLLPHVEQIDRNVSATSEKAERIIQDLQYLKSQSMSLLTDRDMNTTAQESSRQTTAMILSNTEQILQAIEKLGSDSDRVSPDEKERFLIRKLSVDSSDTRIQRSARNYTDAGGHTSKPLYENIHPIYRCRNFSSEIQYLDYFEDQIDVWDLGDLVPMILQRQEDQFQRTVQRAKISTLNHRSSVNGLAPIHFAVLWPAGLKMLLDRNAWVGPEDKYGRQPIHLAVALGIPESVRYLLSADCGLFTPPHDQSLLQHALKLPTPQRSEILHLLIPALTERHTRLIDMAIMFLPPPSLSKLNLAPGQRNEQSAPLTIEALISHGVDIPQALELDGKSFYNFSDMHKSIRLVPEIADALWNAGFQDIDTPDDNVFSRRVFACQVLP